MAISLNPFTGQLDITGGSGSLPTIGSPVVGADPDAVLVTDGSSNLLDVTLSDGELLIGATGAAPIAATLSGTTDQVTVTNAANSITLSLPQDIAVTSSPQFANVVLTPSGSLDITGAGGTLAVGTTNADVINIGNSGATVNIQGTTFYQNVTDLQVTDKNITINVGGSAGSGSNAGILVEENAVITGYVDTSADRNSWELKAPAQAGIITLSPGASGFTIDQGSHNPVTIGTSNGLSLSTQVLSLQLATTTLTGALSNTDWNTFNNKEPSITATTSADYYRGDKTFANFDAAAQSASISQVITNGVTTKAPSEDAVFDALATKEPTITATTSADYYRGDKTFATFDTAAQAATISQVITNGVTTKAPSEDTVFDALSLKLDVSAFTDTAVTSKLITGFVSGAGTVSATDTILQSINKLDGNVATKVTAVTGDIVPTTWSGLANNTANQVITGLLFANTVSSFDCFMNIQIDATTDLYTTVKLIGTRKNATDWSSYDLQVEYTADTITGLLFDITSSGQVRVSIGNISGFSSGTTKFRAVVIT